MLRDWVDDGIKLTVELSTSGDLIVGGTRTNYPFVSGGPNGVPLGWQSYASANLADVNFTTDTGLNRFSVSAIATTSGASTYGAIYYFPVTPGTRVRFGCKVRTMDAKVAGRWTIWNFFALNGVSVTFPASDTGPSQSEWESYSTLAFDVPAGVNQLYISIRGGALGTPSNGWGVQFTEAFIQVVPTAQPVYTWRDITCDSQSFTVRHGRERFTQRYDVGSLSLVVLNADGEYTYRQPHPFGLRPGRFIRIKAAYQSVEYPIFYGVLDSLTDGYGLDGRVICTMVAYDVQSTLSTSTTPSIFDFNYQAKSGARVTALLDVIGYLPRAIDVGQWQTQAIVSNGRTIRDEMGVTADSEGGSVYAERDGRIIYKDRSWVTTDPNLKNVTANLFARPDMGDDETTLVDPIPELPNAPIICVNQLQPAWALDRIINFVELANAGGTAQTFEDEASQLSYGIHTYQRLDYVLVNLASNQNGWLAIRANDLMDGFKDSKVRVNSITYRPGVSDDPQAWPWTLGVFLNWLVRVWYANSLNGWGYAIVTHVQSVQHTVSSRTWETVIALDQPIAYTDAPIIDLITDQWQRGRWQVSQWRMARFTQFARFNMAIFERGKADSLFDTARFDVNLFQ